MFRPIDPACLAAELRRMQRLNQALGVPLLGDYFRRIRRDGWIARNPEIYHLYETAGELRGYTGLVPLYPASFRAFIDGERFPWAHIRPDDILTRHEFARARLEGVWIWIESFLGIDDAARRHVGEYLYHYLSSIHLKGIVVTTSAPPGEECCRWLGLVLLREYEPCPTGARRLWYADEAAVAPNPHQFFGPPVPARCIFVTVRHRFSAPPQTLGLSPTERRVARLFYLDEKTSDAIASSLGIQPGTVKTHLQRIRAKAEPVVGSRLSRRIAAYLHDHPGETTESDP